MTKTGTGISMDKILPPYFPATLPVIITEPGIYLTRCGERVAVTYVAGHRAYGNYACGIKESWHKSGRLFPSTASTNDIVGPEPKEAGSPDDK